MPFSGLYRLWFYSTACQKVQTKISQKSKPKSQKATIKKPVPGYSYTPSQQKRKATNTMLHHSLLLFLTVIITQPYHSSAMNDPLRPPMVAPHPPMAPHLALASPATTTNDDDDGYDDDKDELGDTTPQLVAEEVLNTVIDDADKGEDSAADVMRLMRGGRGRKSVNLHYNPTPELKHCYSAEPGGQRGRWSSDGGMLPQWIPNKRCANLAKYDTGRVVKCFMSGGDGGLQDEPVWLVLAGDFNMWGTYQCLTGTDSRCSAIATSLRDLGYERLQFHPSAKKGNPKHGDSDTFFWPPRDHSLPPLRVSFRHVGGSVGGGNGHGNGNEKKSFLTNQGTDKTRDWNEMHEPDGTLRVPENWLTEHAVHTFGHVPDHLLFSTGRQHISRLGEKDCTTAKIASNFLRATDRVTIKHQLWLSVGGVSPAADKEASSLKPQGSDDQPVLDQNDDQQKNIRKIAATGGPTNQQCVWDAECSRMKAKHHRIPFVDLATRTEAAELPPYPSIFEKDGKHFGIALQEEIIRNWLPFLCHEVQDVREK